MSQIDTQQALPEVESCHASDGLPAMLRLTDDILYEIFCSVALGFPERKYRRRPPITEKYYQSLALSHVCRHWRCTALSSPMLWAYIDITNHSQITLLHAFLERSQAVPLHVKFQGDYLARSNNHFEDKARIVLRHSSRIVMFEAINLSSSLVTTIVSAFTAATPTLQSLTSGTGNSTLVSPSGGNQTPGLRELSTRSVIIAKLEYLDLKSLLLHGQDISARSLLSVLRQCPGLEILEVGVATPGLPSDVMTILQPEGETSVSLSHLRELKLAIHSSDDAIAILPRLHYPDTTTVQLHFDFYSPNIQEISVTDLSDSLRLIMARVRDMGLGMSFNRDTSASIRLTSLDPKIVICWTWTRTLQQDDAGSLIREAGLSTLSLPSIEQLTIVGTAFRPSGRSWRAILEPMRTLSTLELRLCNCRVSLLLDALGAGLDLNPNVICPNLTRCIICETSAGSTVFSPMAVCFLRRAQAGIPLKHLDILTHRDCLPPAIYSALHASVSEVTVRGW